MKPEFDLIVVGGGPGGSTVSTLVASKGHKVLLLEKEEFPRHQIGESLLPATIQGICPLLGVKEEIDKASFVPKKGGTLLWGKSQEPWKFYFDYNAKSGEARATAYQVERCKFDTILLNNAKKKGVDVRHNCCVLDVIKNNNRVVGLKYQDKEGNIIPVYAKYIADASGYNSRIYNMVGERIFSKYFNNIAIYGYFKNGKRLPPPDEGSILVVAFNHGWLWYIPLSDELTSVGIVVGKEQIDGKNLAQNKEEIFNQYIKSARLMDYYLEKAELATDEVYGKIRVRLDYSYTNTHLWKPGMVLIGDSGCFIDPVFSSGVHLSTFSGLLAARSINTALLGIMGEDKVFNEFERRYRKEFSNFYNFLIAFYDMEQTEDDYFWAARRITNSTEKANTAFVKLIAGFSTDGITKSIDTENYFTVREGLGDAFANKFCPENKDLKMEPLDSSINVDLFMGDLTKETINLQAEAMGINLAKINRRNNNLIPSKDFLHWEETIS